MPIKTGDVKIFKSDTMADTPDGGGVTTLAEVVSGQSNNMFEDVSTLDRVFGAVHLRKVYPHVFIQSLDKYLSAHTIISKLPKDEKIGVNLFSTGDYHDRRPAAQSRIESYRSKGGNYIGFLLATQFKGSRVITIFQSVDAELPVISDVLYLTQNGDTQNQYVKITKVSSKNQQFTINNITFTRTIVTLEISQALEYDFIGANVSRDDNIKPTATILTTVVANAAKYYSARKLETVAAKDATTIKTKGIFSQVVPSSLQEVATVNIDALDAVTGLLQTGTTASEIVTNSSFEPSTSFYLGSSCYPGTLDIVIANGNITDNGGKIFNGTSEIGTISYRNGVMQFASNLPVIGGTKTIKFQTAAVTTASGDSALIEIVNGNRGNLYTFTIVPPPKPGTVKVSYRSFGNWYDLSDNAAGGIIAQENGIGTGTIDYVSGSATLTLTALPDVGSAILLNWGKMINYFDKTSVVPKNLGHVRFQLTKNPLPVSLTITWNDGTARSATVNSAGAISGDATGLVNKYSGVVQLIPNVLIKADQQFTVAYDHGVNVKFTANNVTLSSGSLIVNVGQTNIIVGSVILSWKVSVQEALSPAAIAAGVTYSDETVVAVDDANGIMKRGNITVGSVNYVTGVITITDPTTTSQFITVASVAGNWVDVFGNSISSISWSQYNNTITGTVTVPTAGTSVEANVRIAGSTVNKTETITSNQMRIDLSDFGNGEITEGSVRFKLGNLTYVDRGNQLFHSIDNKTGVGTLSGTINRSSGQCVITQWSVGVTNTLSLESLASSGNLPTVSSGVLRVPNAPVRLNSLQIRAQTPNGAISITGNADAAGLITGSNIEGAINYDTGVVKFRFGESVVAAGNESAYWYKASEVDSSGNIFKPTFVTPASIKYDAVSQTFIPLDASILGLNPVRLPEDGRVPIYAKGDVVVVLNEAITSGTYTSNSTTNLGRLRIAKLRIADSNGAEIPTTAYDANLDTGIISWKTLTGLSQPLTITHRIEDSAVLTDVQITGDLTLSQPLTHDYPLAGTLVSNAVLHGDIFAFVNKPFDQKTFTGVWSNALIGDETLAEFNDAAHPIVVDNASAITERWLVQFVNSTTVNIIGEKVGQVATNVPISADIAPLNPATNFPYFKIIPAAWGGGWSSGNVVRFNTQSASVPLWVIQSVGQGAATNTDADALTWCMEFRGDRDTVPAP